MPKPVRTHSALRRDRAVARTLSEFDALLAQVRACGVCEAALPLGPRPILQMSPAARILIASQAPGSKVHASGIPFSDPSGDRLRAWMGISEARFYDPDTVAIVPMGLCYPGRKGSGDAPPRPECAPLWRDRLLAAMPAIRLTLLVGSYAQNYALGPDPVTERVRDFAAYLPRYFPLPHPSWRVVIWSRKHPWFEAEVLPALREAIGQALAGGSTGS
jgi:uracil-DNA glycosylase